MRIIIECPESILHLEAEYIYADCLFASFKPLAVQRRTIHFANGLDAPSNVKRSSYNRQSIHGSKSCHVPRSKSLLKYPSRYVRVVV